MRGLNVVGLRRAGVDADTRKKLKQAYRLLYRSGLNISQALDAVRGELLPDETVDYLVTFIDASERGITPGADSEAGEDE
jgi:UDP-N-acetylglucosamine acyltransferase